MPIYKKITNHKKKVYAPEKLWSYWDEDALTAKQGVSPMEFKILKTDFLAALNQVQGVVEKKNIMPILANVLLEAEVPLLKVSATDLEVAVNVLTQAQVKKPGKITVLARKLFDIVKEAAGEEIIIKTSENDRVEITSRQTQCKIVGLSANEFPKLPDVEGELIPVETSTFLDVLEKVGFAMSTDETRYHLNGVYVEKQGSDTVFVATDGHRLSLVRTQLCLPEIAGGIIIPRKGVNELRKVISVLKGFEFCVGKKYAFVRSEKETLFIRLIDGDFPNYRRVIPENTQIKVKVPREELVGALKRVSLLSDEYSKGVKLYFCNGALLVNTANLEVGEAKEELSLDFSGEAFEVSFNARYLLDVLGVVHDEFVVLGFNDKSSPCVVTCESSPGFCSVVMPMRV